MLSGNLPGHSDERGFQLAMGYGYTDRQGKKEKRLARVAYPLFYLPSPGTAMPTKALVDC